MTSLALQQASVIEDAIRKAAHERTVAGSGKDTYYSHASGLIYPEDHFMIEISAFLQTWSSTALGFGGVGGQAISAALTTVVIFWDSENPDFWSKAYIYFGGRFAYSAHPTNSDFIDDLANHKMPSVSDQDYSMERA